MYGKNLKARNASVNSEPGKDCWTEVEEKEEEEEGGSISWSTFLRWTAQCSVLSKQAMFVMAQARAEQARTGNCK